MDPKYREQLIVDRRFEELLGLQVAEVQSEPEDPEGHRQMAWVLAALGRLSEAVDEQRHACRLRPDNVIYAETLKDYQAKLPVRPDDASEPSDVAEVFRRIHRANHWRSAESVSGPGSGLAVTAPLRAALPSVLRGLGIKSMLDAPCGDFGWMSATALDLDRYTGIDIVPELIEAARASADARHVFSVGDITQDPLPRADLILCRDCLVHLTDEQAFTAIENFKRSGSTFLLTTTFYAMAENVRGSTGGWRPINLQRPPFSFPPPRLLIPERAFDPGRAHSDKSLGVWEISALPDELEAPSA